MLTLHYSSDCTVSRGTPRQELVVTTTFAGGDALPVSTDAVHTADLFSDSNDRASRSIVTFHYPNLDPRDWDARAQKRFHHLSVKEALQTISSQELSELDQLQILRRLAENQTTAKQVLFEVQRQQALADIKETLDRYSDVFRRFTSRAAPSDRSG
jgi:hypothetical protein